LCIKCCVSAFHSDIEWNFLTLRISLNESSVFFFFFSFFNVTQVAIIPQEIWIEWQWSHRRFSLNGENT
jgi:hypothetical protein